ncbi:MAG: glycine cleavage system protein T [Gammaproteobacteria bacterium]|jgi:aminomethyltransferase|nr:glycine cleavage system protein T [Gammaproteobacteria bacterium]
MSNQTKDIGFGTQIRKSPFFDATLRYGAEAFSVYNHMYLPRDFGDPVENYWNLVNAAILCDVAVERQVEITGPDAARFVQLLTPRNLSQCQVGQCRYVLITSEEGGIINDPVLLKLGDNHFWLSLSDSDVLLWAKGIAVHSGMDVSIREPDVSPLQLQGPRSLEILKALFGDEIGTLRYYWFRETELDGIPLVVSRTGWSGELGYEIYLRDASRGDELWERIIRAGKPFGLCAGHTSTIRRIEGGMLSYHADMDMNTNPFELGLDRLVDLDMEDDFIGKAALRRIKAEGIRRKLVGLVISGPPIEGSNTRFWPLLAGDIEVGTITSAVYSPRLTRNIALALVSVDWTGKDSELLARCASGDHVATVVDVPFIDPQKQLPKSSEQ